MNGPPSQDCTTRHRVELYASLKSGYRCPASYDHDTASGNIDVALSLSTTNSSMSNNLQKRIFMIAKQMKQNLSQRLNASNIFDSYIESFIGRGEDGHREKMHRAVVGVVAAKRDAD